ncbi:MAG TPA: hypothetical protein VFX51_26270 [Solirubrobacteraceae bacterium]|nr:hypothetical protein [Solirubrobacteraceae bacterium]
MPQTHAERANGVEYSRAMGLLSRLNRRSLDVLDPEIVDPGFKRADRALENGAVASATLVGIEQKLDDSTTTRFVVVDPKDPAKAVVDWAAAANEPGRSPGRLDDSPPDGSAAALLVL